MAENFDKLKKTAAVYAVDKNIHSNQTIGLGTGSTTLYAIEHIGHLYKTGKIHNILCIPTSLASEALAQKLGLPLGEKNSLPDIDVTIDGADQVMTNLTLIKGKGGALVREKIVELHTKRVVIIVDESKIQRKEKGLVDCIPIEILPFGYERTVEKILQLKEVKGAEGKIKEKDGEKYVTDNGNFLLELCWRGGEEELGELGEKLKSLTGVIDHGIFLNIAHQVIVAKGNGVITELDKSSIDLYLERLP